jgi:Gpi18-like mannosyltransferase
MKQRITKVAAIYFCLLAVSSAVIMFIVMRDRSNTDLTDFVLPWFAQLTEHGLHAISGTYSAYTPTYLYFLATVAPLHSIISDVVLIKSVSMAFNFIGAFIVYLIVLEVTMDKRISAVAGAGALLLPTVVMNSAYWGQCDAIYSTFVLSFVLFNLKGATGRAVFCLGLAFSFKLQAIFVAPYVLYLILRKRIGLQHLLVVPIVYAATMFPAYLMGRPASELATIYLGQIHEYGFLSLSAPNLYEIIQHFHLVGYHFGVRAGLILATAVGITLAISAQRLPDDLRADLLVVTASVILMPFVLPKMHDRYFFLADILTYVLAFTFSRAWLLAIGMQIGSLSAYCKFLFDWHFGPSLGALAVGTASVGIVWLGFVHARTMSWYNPQIGHLRDSVPYARV